MMYAFRYCIFLSLFMFAISSNAKICRPFPRGNTDAISGLIYCINQANSSLEDDIIDLGGAIYTLDGTNLFFDTNGGVNGLPIITANSGKLSIITGTIERSSLITTPLFRFFYIETGAPVYLYNVTLENGSSFLIGTEASQQQNGTEQQGLLASGQDGGAIYNLGILNLRNTFLLNNYADGIGGAIYNNGTIAEIYNSIFSGNKSNAFSIFNGGGAIFNDDVGVINGIDDTTISNNRANNGNGGGIYNNGIIESIRDSTIDNNFAYQNGGGIYNHTQIVKAMSRTAEIYSISNNTFYGNIAANRAGIFNESIIDAINNNTISGNGSGGTAFGGGIYNDIDAVIYVFVSNIVASNSAFANGQDVYNVGIMVSQNNNLLSSSVGNGIVNGIDHNIVTVTPLLGAFQDNGGPTFTIALLPGSLAINHGDNPDALSYDQRGYPYYRTVCGVPDIGAYERPGCHN